MDDATTSAGDDLLIEREVCAILRRPRGTLAYWRSVGEGPAWFKIGRGVVYRRSAVEDFIREAESARPASAAR